MSRPYQIAVAHRLAEQLVEALRPACERIEIVGSVRRQRPLVKDIEILICPRQHLDLLEQPCGSQVDDLLLTLRREQRLLEFLALKNGDRYKQFRLRHKTPPGWAAIKLDLFVADVEAWGVAMAIRTGPAAFSKRLVINRGQNGRLANDLTVGDGYRLWRGRRIDEFDRVEDPGTLVPCDDEREFFDKHAGGWIAPEHRDDPRLTSRPQRSRKP